MKKSVAIIGSGPSALMLAAQLDPFKFDVTIYEKNKSVARKFLVAGDGGFNLTHSEQMDVFMEKYTPSSFLNEALEYFSNKDLVNWLLSIGIPTYVGSSKRIFPREGIKPIEVLQKIIHVLGQNSVTIKFQHEWKGWDADENLIFNSDIKIKPDISVFAMGGGSWKVTGSDGSWLNLFADKGITVFPFRASNCAFNIQWPEEFLSHNEGKPLKNILISCDDKEKKGEVVITRNGLEGNAIYALSPQIQGQLVKNGSANIVLDLKPDLLFHEILFKIAKPAKKMKLSEVLLKVVNLTSTQLSLLKSSLTKEAFLNPETLSFQIKNLPLIITDTAPIDEAISTTGGIDIQELNSNYELNALKNTYCIGEMVNWDAPTGGYLLQGSFSMGAFLAKKLNEISLT